MCVAGTRANNNCNRGIGSDVCLIEKCLTPESSISSGRCGHSATRLTFVSESILLGVELVHVNLAAEKNTLFAARIGRGENISIHRNVRKLRQRRINRRLFRLVKTKPLQSLC